MNRRFDEAWQAAWTVTEEMAAEGVDVVLVRDILGRVAVLVDDGAGRRSLDRADQRRFAALLRERCAPFVAAQPVTNASALFTPEAVTAAPDLVTVRPGHPGEGLGRIAVLEHGVVGREWRRVSPGQANRVTLYGFKGGVGRSTATVVLAQHLARRGCCVLAVDLDLESPGMSPLAVDTGDLPDHGLVDYLVESGVDNTAELACVVRSNRLRVPGNGEVWVAPAGGRPRPGYSYLPKLNRAYLDYPATGQEGESSRTSFAERLAAAVDYCVAEVERLSRQPDVVLLDSRAGIHDIAAVAITRLSDLTLLFGKDSVQSWAGYRELFQQWNQDAKLVRGIRERLRMVAAMVPPAREEEYLAGFRDRAQLLFSEYLYDEADADDPDAFNPPPSDLDAPHSPLPVLFTTDLVGVDVTARRDWLEQDFVTAAFHRFVDGAAELILTGGAR